MRKLFFFVLVLGFCVNSSRNLSEKSVFPGETFEDLALFDDRQTLLRLEDGLDEWHEKYMRLYVDNRYRILTVSSIFSQDALEGGGFILYALIAYYLFLSIYMLHKKFVISLNNELLSIIEFKDDLFRPLLYCVLNTMCYSLICFYDVFDTQSNFGVATVLGSDAINIFFVFGMVLHRFYTKKPEEIDIWIYLRDFLYYLLGVGLLITFFMVESITWYFSLILLAYYVAFYVLQSKNDAVKENIFRILGFTQEDENYHVEEHFIYAKRRDSVTFLNESNFIDKSDQTLQKKLNRTEAILKINFKDSPNKWKIYANFQKLVYITLYAIRNKHKAEKIERAAYYHRLHNKDPIRQNSRKGFEQNSASQKNLEGSKAEIPLKKEFEDYEERAKREDLPPANEINLLKNANKLNENDAFRRDKDGNPVANVEANKDEDEENEEDEEISLKWPTTFKAQVYYMLFFPINLFLFLLPNYRKNSTPKKIAFSSTVYLVVLGILLFFFSRCLQIVALGVQMNEETMGMIFCALGLSYPFIRFHFKVAKYEKENVMVESFLQIGIYKVGVCVGVSWLFGCIVFLSNNLKVSNDLFRFGIVAAIFAGGLALTVLATLGNKMKLSKGLAYPYLFAIFAVGIAATVVLETNK